MLALTKQRLLVWRQLNSARRSNLQGLALVGAEP